MGNGVSVENVHASFTLVIKDENDEEHRFPISHTFSGTYTVGQVMENLLHDKKFNSFLAEFYGENYDSLEALGNIKAVMNGKEVKLKKLMKESMGVLVNGETREHELVLTGGRCR